MKGLEIMENKIKKITKAQRINDIIAMVKEEEVTHGTTTEEALEFLNHELELLNRKGSKSGKPTKSQLRNLELAPIVYEYLKSKDEGVRATEIMKNCDLESTQRAVSVLSHLINEKKAENLIVKGVSLYKAL